MFSAVRYLPLFRLGDFAQRFCPGSYGLRGFFG